MKYRMKTILRSSAVRSLAIGAALTALAYCSGGMRYPSESGSVPSIAVQLLTRFALYFLISFLTLVLFGIAEQRWKKK